MYLKCQKTNTKLAIAKTNIKQQNCHLVAFYDNWPGNESGLFLCPRAQHWVFVMMTAP